MGGYGPRMLGTHQLIPKWRVFFLFIFLFLLLLFILLKGIYWFIWQQLFCATSACRAVGCCGHSVSFTTNVFSFGKYKNMKPMHIIKKKNKNLICFLSFDIFLSKMREPWLMYQIRTRLPRCSKTKRYSTNCCPIYPKGSAQLMHLRKI